MTKAALFEGEWPAKDKASSMRVFQQGCGEQKVYPIMGSNSNKNLKIVAIPSPHCCEADNSNRLYLRKSRQALQT